MLAAAGFNNGSFTEDRDAFGLSDWCATLVVIGHTLVHPSILFMRL